MKLPVISLLASTSTTTVAATAATAPTATDLPHAIDGDRSIKSNVINAHRIVSLATQAIHDAAVPNMGVVISRFRCVASGLRGRVVCAFVLLIFGFFSGGMTREGGGG